MSTNMLEFIADTPGERLDKTILAHIGSQVSRAQLQTLISEGQVTVNDATMKPGIKLKGGERIRITLPQSTPAPTMTPEALELTIVYEDEDLVVIDKPAGMIVHPGEQNETGTLASAALARWPHINGMDPEGKRNGIVHRLDKDTSGLIVLALNEDSQQALQAQFQDRSVEKIYIALLERRPETPTGRVDAPIARDPQQRKRMAVVRDGKPAITEFTVLESDFTGDQALVKLHLLTGRTHQIRVHMAFIGCPVVGDRVYGYRKQRLGLKRQFLHAAELSFDHPTTGQRLHFEAPLPAGLQNILSKLRSR